MLRNPLSIALPLLLLCLYRSESKVINVSKEPTETDAKNWIANDYNPKEVAEKLKVSLAGWAYETNITDKNGDLQSAAESHATQFSIEAAKSAKYYQSHVKEIKDSSIKRQLKLISVVGIKLDSNDSLTLSSLVTNMTGAYGKAKICSWEKGVKNCSIQWALEPELTRILAKSRDYDLLKYVWEEWRAESGAKMKETYEQFVNLSNKGAKADGFNDTGDYWRYGYEDPNFRQTVDDLWLELLPLYEQLHTYARRQLKKQYEGKFNTSAIPAHILGNMWSQTWGNILNFSVPYANEPKLDVTDEMLRQNYTPSRMFHMADEFFGSLGLIRMPQSFWSGSMIEKPSDREVVCHASAWDFSNGKDYRIKMCTDVTEEDLITIHHEMGHVEYYLQYAKQPITFQDGANDGFHEAIGDTMALSAGTPKHFKAVGLLSNGSSNERQELNYLYAQALDKIAFLPFGYIMDLWRWKVFDGSSPVDSWNDDWHKLAYKYQGVVPPAPRPINSFDPGAKFHVPSNTPYLRYFISFVIQFQFYESLCNASGHTGPLHQCDFYKSKSAGNLLAEMLQLGSSQHWSVAMKAITGGSSMSVEPLMTYFRPLIDWLTEQNRLNNECFGWGYEWPPAVMQKLEKNRCGLIMA